MAQFLPVKTVLGGTSARTLRPVFVIAIALAVAFGTFQLASLYKSIGSAMQMLSRGQTDNKTWLVAQSEVDLLKYRLALSDTLRDPSPDQIEDLRNAFDILYSRVMLIEIGMAQGSLPDTAGIQRDWSAARALVQRDAAIFDSGDDAVVAQLAELRQRAETAAVSNRAFTVNALALTIDAGMLQRQEMRNLVERFFVTGALMFMLLVTLALSMTVVLRRLERQARVESRLNSNLNKLINASIDGVLVINGEGRVLGCNSAAQSMFGLTEQEMRAFSLKDFLCVADPGDLVGDTPGTWGNLLSQGQVARRKAMRHDGTGFPAEVVLASDRGSDQQPIHFVFIRDISDHVRIESSLKTARDAAVRGEEAKSRFLAVMSHEMRTPLNGLIAALDIVQKTTRLSRKQASFLSLARQCGDTSLEQIDDVLELIRLGRDQQSDDPEDFDLIEVLTVIVDQNRPPAALRGNVLSVEMPQAAPFRVIGHRRLLARVLLNLLGNAVKFTLNGTIVLRALSEDTDADGGLLLTLQVTDTGIGIAQDMHDRIFSDFETIDSSFARLREGSGLGLGIVRRAVDLMGGTIALDSEEGRGSTFTVRLPLRRSAAGPVAEVVPDALPPIRKGRARSAPFKVLIAEDNAINRIVLTEMLRVLGCRIDEAVNGVEAVTRAARTRYDLILMDLSMPQMDGIEATAQIRAAGASIRSRIVGLTAHVMAETMDRMMDSGLDAVLPKPVTLEVLARLLEAGPVAQQAEPPPQGGLPLLSEQVFGPLSSSFAPDDLGRLVTAFRQETETLLAGLRRAPDLEACASALHQIAGSAAVFGALRLKDLLNAAETRVRTKKRAPGAATLAKIDACWTETQMELDRQMDAPAQPVMLTADAL